MRLLSTALLAVFVVHAGYSDTDVVQIPERAIVGQVVTFDLPIEGVAGNPYDAAEMTLDVEFTTPDGEVIRVPGFYEEQYDVTIGWPEMIVDRLGFGPFKIGPGQRQNPYVLVDNVRLVEEKTGDEVILDDFESGSTWYEHGIILEVVDGGVDEGKCLKFTLSKDSPEKYPVAFRRLDDTDWTRYRALRFSLKLEEPLPPDDFDFVLYRKHNQRYNTHSIHFPGLKVGEWNEIEIPLEPRTETAEVSWAGSDGWRVRYMPAVPGRYTAKAIYKADTYREELPFRFRVENGEYGGFVRVSENDHRYLVRDDGSPVMLNGFNVLSSNVGYYKTYLDKMHEAGCNFIRIWMSPNTFGFERKLNQYDQRRSAQMDTLVEMCNQLGVYIMPSLIDFRSLQADASWRWAPWNVDNDGYLESPDDFFTHPQTMPAMRNLMRYFVARWGAYPSVLCWEYFNEVNNVDTWGQGEFIDPAVVRTWNQQMSELAREIDPYGRLLTTSFAELEDDEIWEQPGMDLVQRHFYLKPGTPFVDFSLKAYEVLARHNKPVLTGEFGRSQNTFAAETKDGITLHNGIWSAALSGAAGTGMDWWWRWIDDYDLYFHFEYLNRFLEGIQWDQEDFKMERVKVTAKGEVFNTPILFAPQSSAYFFSPHLHHRPNTVVLDAEGFPDVYEHIPQRLFGEEDENYNPVTFQTIYQSDGHFRIVFTPQSNNGKLKVIINDGDEEIYELDRAYDGKPYIVTIPIERGANEIILENGGSKMMQIEWFETIGIGKSVEALGAIGRNTALVWVHNKTHRWDYPLLDMSYEVAEDVSVDVDGLESGVWEVRPYIPWTGVWSTPYRVNVIDGSCRLGIRILEKDLAFKMVKLSGARNAGL